MFEVVELPPFSLHSGMWMNLHHYLYGQAASGDEAVPGSDHRAAGWKKLAEPEQRLWRAAIDTYGKSWATNDLLFNPELSEIKASLLAQEQSEQIALPAPPLGELLSGLASSYRHDVWPTHHQRNLEWMTAARPLVTQHGQAIMKRLSTLYRTPWQKESARVDVCMSANWAGAYTSTRPATHIVIASDDDRNQGAYALEILFHEASHAMIFPIKEAVKAEASRQGVEEPPNLWHAILFYSSGRAVAELLPGHQIYADREKLWQGQWEKYRAPLGDAWQKYMDGQDSFENALAAVVRAVSG